MFLKGCKQRDNMNKSKIPMSIFNYFRGQYQSWILNNLDKGKMYFVTAIICDDLNPFNGSLMHKVWSLIALSVNCYINDEFLMGRKSIIAAFKLSDEYFIEEAIFDYYTCYKERIDNEILNTLIH